MTDWNVGQDSKGRKDEESVARDYILLYLSFPKHVSSSVAAHHLSRRRALDGEAGKTAQDSMWLVWRFQGFHSNPATRYIVDVQASKVGGRPGSGRVGTLFTYTLIPVITYLFLGTYVPVVQHSFTEYFHVVCPSIIINVGMIFERSSLHGEARRASWVSKVPYPVDPSST